MSRRQTGIAGLFKQFLVLGAEERALKARRETLKASLNTFVLENHEEDEEKGHLVYRLPAPVDDGKYFYDGFMRQRKVTQVFLEDAAEELCAAKGLEPDEYTTRYVDQDKVVRLYAEEKITDEEFGNLFDNNESWAFVPIKGA